MWRYGMALMLVVGTPAMAQVEQGRANAGFTPAFEGQTRAPEMPQSEIGVSVFAEGLSFPWGIAWLPDGRFLVSQRGGEMRMIGPNGALMGDVTGLPDVAAVGQGGLLDVAVSPDFASDSVVYWTYSKAVGGGAALAAARGILVDGAMTQVRDIFVQTPAVNGGRHFGSRVVPVRGGVFVTSGDRGTPSLVQDATTSVGKVIWIEDGGTPQIWSGGHRNIQGAVMRDGELWTVEHGPRGGDELNRPEAGENYGWPVISYGINYNGSDVGGGLAVDDGYEQPVYYWDPVIAPGGMAAYPMDAGFAPWRGDLFVSSLNPGGVMRLKIEGGRVAGEERLLSDVGRVRDVELLPDGDLLVLLDAPDAQILRITPHR